MLGTHCLESSSPTSFPGESRLIMPGPGMPCRGPTCHPRTPPLVPARTPTDLRVERRLRHGQNGLCQRQRHADTREERRMRACCRTLRPPPAPCWLRQGCQQAPMSRRRLSLAQRAPADQPRPRWARADRQCVHTLCHPPLPVQGNKSEQQARDRTLAIPQVLGSRRASCSQGASHLRAQTGLTHREDSPQSSAVLGPSGPSLGAR